MTRRRGRQTGISLQVCLHFTLQTKLKRRERLCLGLGQGHIGNPPTEQGAGNCFGVRSTVHPVKCLCVPSAVLGTAPVPLTMLHVTLHTLQVGKPRLTEFSAFPPSWYSSTVTQDSLMALGRAWEWTRMETLASAWVSVQGEGNQKNT